MGKSKYDKEIVDRIIGCLRKGHTHRDSCALVGIDEDTMTAWLHKYPKFAAQVKEAESHIIELALSVVEQALAQNNSKLAMQILKARRSDIWKPKEQLEISTPEDQVFNVHLDFGKTKTEDN